MHRLSRAAALLIFCASLGGCGRSGPETATVGGKVTLRGQPIANGRIVFSPENGRMALGAISPDGSYKLTTFTTDDGAVLGKHRVTVTATKSDSAGPKSFEEERRGVGVGRRPVESIIPTKYARPETSPLTAEVVRGSNTFNFDLQ